MSLQTNVGRTRRASVKGAMSHGKRHRSRGTAPDDEDDCGVKPVKREEMLSSAAFRGASEESPGPRTFQVSTEHLNEDDMADLPLNMPLCLQPFHIGHSRIEAALLQILRACESSPYPPKRPLSAPLLAVVQHFRGKRPFHTVLSECFGSRALLFHHCASANCCRCSSDWVPMTEQLAIRRSLAIPRL